MADAPREVPDAVARAPASANDAKENAREPRATKSARSRKGKKPKRSAGRIEVLAALVGADAVVEDDGAEELANRLLTQATTSGKTPYSRDGPHPAEWKRHVGDAVSAAVVRVARRGIVLQPSAQDELALDAVRRTSKQSAGTARRAALQSKETKATTDAIVAELRAQAWELREVAYMPGDDLGFIRLAQQIGAIVVDVPPALQTGAFLQLCRRARAEGVLVLQCSRVGHYLAHSKHPDISQTNALPSKRTAPRLLGLEKRCETRDDGCRELTLFVMSMPGTAEERTAFREHVLPRLKHRCRARRIRLNYVDLKDDCPKAGPGQALNALEHAMKTGGIFVVLVSAKHEIDWYSSVRLNEYVQYMKNEAQSSAVSSLAWLRMAPNDYSRVELQVAHLLRLYDDIYQPSLEDFAKATEHLTERERKRIQDEKEEQEKLRHQHVLAYFPNKLFYERVRAQKDTEYEEYLTSADNVHQERVGALVSTLYAHVDVSVSQYNARFVAPLHLSDEKNIFKIRQPPRAEGLLEFRSTVLRDVWTRIDLEFRAEPLKDKAHSMAAIEPELSLGERLPFYFHRPTQEKMLIKAIKTGQPSTLVVQGLPGAGTTSMLQYIAHVTRHMFIGADPNTKIDRVIVLNDYGAAEGRKNPTPTQILRNIAQQIKEKLGFEDHIPASLENVRATLMSMLNRATRSRGRVIIFIDALHLVDNMSGAAWLPNEHEIPAGVQFFLGICRIDRMQGFEKEISKKHPKRMATVDYNLITQYRYRMVKLQHVALAASCPKALKHSIILHGLKFDERKMYANRYLRPLGIHLTNSMLMQIMDKTCAENLRGMYLTCSRIAMEDAYDDAFFALLTEMPQNERDYYHQILDGVERFVPDDLLGCVLTTIACACNCLTRYDVARLIISNSRKSANIYDLMDRVVPQILWAVRFFVKGSAQGGADTAATGSLKVEDRTAYDVIMERYAPKEQNKRHVYQMLARYYGNQTTGSRILERLHAVKDQVNAGIDPYEEDEDGLLVNDTLHKEAENTLNTIKYLPYYYTQARMFDQLVDILTDPEFIQAKLEIGEGQSMVEDFDRILPFTCGPERPLWISHHASLNEEVVGVPGAPSGLDGRMRQQAILNSHCMGFHIEAYQFYATHSDKTHLTEDLIALREFLWKNLEMLHRDPMLLRQQLFNDIGDAAPRKLGSAGIVEPSESAIREYSGSARLMLRWENRPSEALTSISTKSGYEREGDVRQILTLDDASFVVGYASGAVEVWDANRGSSVARFVGHDRPVTALALINNDAIRNARTSAYIVSGSKDKTVRVWRLDDCLGADCTILTGHTEPIAALEVALAANELFSLAGVELRCWSCSPGYPLRYVLNTESTSPVTSMVLAPDLSFLITANTEGIMRMWLFALDYAQTKESASFHAPALNQEATYSGVGSESNAARSKRKVASNPPAVALELRGHIGEVTCVTCSSNGLFASGGVDTSIMLWEPKKAKHIGLIRAHERPITALRFSRDGKLLISASLERACRIHSSLTGALVASMDHPCRVLAADVSPDASCIVTGGSDGNLRLWSWTGRKGTASVGALPRTSGTLRRAPTKEEEAARAASGDTSAPIHKARVTAACHVQLGGNSSCFITAANDGSVRVIDERDWKLRMDAIPLQANGVQDAIEFTPSPIMAMHSAASDSIVYFGRSDGSLTAWDFGSHSWAWVKSKTIPAHELGVYSMTDMGYGTLVTGGGGGLIRVWDVHGRSPTLMKSLEGHNARVTALCADSSLTLYSTGGDTVVKSWDLDKEMCKQNFLGHEATTVACAFTKRGLVTMDVLGEANLWDVRASSPAARFTLPPGVPLSCQVVEDQPNWIVTTCDHAMYVHDVRNLNSGKAIMTFPCPRACTRLEHEDVVSAAAFNPAGTRAIMADAHGRVYGLTTAFLSAKIHLSK